MPKKIEFNTIQATSEDSKYRLQELNTHSPTVRGWRSTKNCSYPQELILQLEKRCSLTKIQILAHQYMIPSKVELYSSNNAATENLDNIDWEYIGYITLSNNETSEFKSRELKSANVPKCVASLVKMHLHQNHDNMHNAFNQVSLIAINILGNELDVRQSASDPNETAKLNDIISNPEYVSQYDDLAFEMYVDTEVAKLIREMEIKKHLAVINERFEYARKLKHAMLNLRTAGEKLGKYELEKRHAIELEDYERARHKKNQMDEYRSNIYQEYFVEQLLENKGICAKNDECLNDEPDNAKTYLLSPTMLKRAPSPGANQISPLHKSRQQSPKTGSPCTGSPTNFRGSFRRRNKSAGAIVKSTYEMYEDKPLPALRHSQTNEFLRECQMEVVEPKTTSKLTEREKKQAALPILVFGTDLVEKFYSKHYCDKEDGLTKLKDDLLAYDTARMHTANKIARAAIFLLHRSLRDKVFSVYNLANEVIRLFFVQFVPGRVSPAEVSRSVDKLLPELLTKSGDTSARIHHMAVHTILTMADCKNVRDLHLIPVHLSRPVSSSTHPRLALSRAEMVEQLILNHGISTEKASGLTCRTLSEFGSSALHHPAELVRKVGERILVLIYKVNPRLVRKQLPPDDDITRRNLLYRQLFHEFDKIDLERKKELLERNRLIQQSNNASDCLSPELNQNGRNEIAKCHSSNNIFNYDGVKGGSYALSKSLSGGNLVQNNGSVKNNEANNEKHSSSGSGISTPNSSNSQKDEEKQCIFCNQLESVILVSNNSMNSHYWRSCPMLVRCIECSQVVEVATLIEHLLIECEKHEEFVQCSQCSEAVKNSDYQKHLVKCSELTEGFNRCPLCHENLEDEELCWKKHLMGEKACLKNARIKTQVPPKQVKIQI